VGGGRSLLGEGGNGESCEEEQREKFAHEAHLRRNCEGRE
jgi:hypothetical protein